MIFGINPFTLPEYIKEEYLPVLTDIFKDAGYRARTIIVNSYEALTQGIAEGIIDVGWFSPFAYVDARDKAGVSPLVTPMINGTYSYKGLIVTHKDSGITSLKELGDKRVGFVDKKSASGYIYAKHMMSMNGVDVNRDLKEALFMGSHDQVIQGVLSKEVHAGATYDEALAHAEKNGKDLSNIRTLISTDDIPKLAISASPKMSGDKRRTLIDAFLTYKGFSDFNTPIEGFAAAKDEHYDIIREVL